MTFFGFLLLIFAGLYTISPRYDLAGRRTAWPQHSHRCRSAAKRRMGRDFVSLSRQMQAEFSGWLDCFGDHVDPWLAFELHIADALRRTCSADDVLCYRVLGDESLLLPLRGKAPRSTTDPRTPSDSVAGWVVRHVQPFYSSRQNSNEQIMRRVNHVDACVSWAFPVISGWSVIGVATVGALSKTAHRDARLLERLAEVVSKQWRYIAEMCCAGEGGVDEAATELMTRTRFMQHAAQLVLRSRRIFGALADSEIDSHTTPNTRIEPAAMVASEMVGGTVSRGEAAGVKTAC